MTDVMKGGFGCAALRAYHGLTSSPVMWKFPDVLPAANWLSAPWFW